MDVCIEFYHDTGLWTVYSLPCGVVIKEFLSEEEAYDFVKISGYNLKKA
tara:strand:+ start:42793 stop:42939 length:147 start_codon:yes stop_codon:yes gene_type:complete